MQQASNLSAAPSGGTSRETVKQTEFRAAAQIQVLIHQEISDDFLTQYFACPIGNIPDWAVEIAAKLVLEPV